MTWKDTNSRMQKKPNNFGLKYGNQKKHYEKAEWINNMTRELKRLEEGSKAEIHIDLLKTTCLQRAHVPEWMTKGKTTLIQKGPKQMSRPKQLQTHNLPTDDVENINSTNKGRDLLLANKPRIVPWGTKWMPQRIQRHCRVTLHRPAHPDENKTRRINLAMAWIDNKKAYNMVPRSWIINSPKD